MASTSKHHHELTNGVGKCSVPMWMGGFPAGFCDKPAYGPPVPPHHYHMHLMHGAQILGYKHPDPKYRSRWNHFYLRCLDDSHTPHPETESEMDERLNDWNRKQWDNAERPAALDGGRDA